MAIMKRLDKDDPLTEHDIAERLSKAALRTWRIMYDLRINYPEVMEPVKSSRYWTGTVNHLLNEMLLWGLQPWPLRNEVGDAREDGLADRVLVDRALLREVIEQVQEARSGSSDAGLRQTYGLRRKRVVDRLLALLED